MRLPSVKCAFGRKGDADAAATSAGLVLLQARDAAGKVRWRRFDKPEEIVAAGRIDEVVPALRKVEEAVENGLHAAGFIAYEAAPAFDPALVAYPDVTPLLWFGLYGNPVELDDFVVLDADGGARGASAPRTARRAVSAWEPSVSREEYGRAIARIRDYISAGDTYQVNYTFRLQTQFRGDPLTFFGMLRRAQSVSHGAYVDTGEKIICSVSPELFFRLDGRHIESRPMKGTAARGLTWEQDEEAEQRLRESRKNRAENVMIVDMVRNDLGRIAECGTVEARSLFDVERYQTVLQMTSTVEAETGAGYVEIFNALFPPASITGAPKVRTMEIIRELESTPRGVYTGCIGYMAPGRRAEFNVAIRTVEIDRTTGMARYGTGGGIVWDSLAEEEYDECCTKASVLMTSNPPFSLLETLLWERNGGYFLLEEHLERLKRSAAYFAFPADIGAVRRRLDEIAAGFAGGRYRVRLLVDEGGKINVQALPLAEDGGGLPVSQAWRVGMAGTPINVNDPFLYHKTTRRDVYEEARAEFPHLDDVILWNERGEITESTVANVIARIDGEWVTPPVACGLLAGTYRARLLREGRLRERVISKEDLARAEDVCLVNAVRGWVPAHLVFE